MTNDEYLEFDLYWCDQMRRYAGSTVRVTEGSDKAGFIGELLGFCGMYNDGSAMLLLRDANRSVLVSSDHIEYI